MSQDELTGTVGWRLSRHARDSAAARGFATADVLLAATYPEVTYTQEDYGLGRRIHQRGDLAVVVNIESLTVVTVLWRRSVDWTDVEARNRHAPAA